MPLSRSWAIIRAMDPLAKPKARFDVQQQRFACRRGPPSSATYEKRSQQVLTAASQRD